MINNVIEKLLSRVGNDIDKSKFSAFYNLVLLPIAKILEPLESRADRIESFQGLLYPEYLSEEEMDVLASNFLLSRFTGTPGKARAKLVVKNNVETEILAGSTFSIKINDTTYYFTADGTILYPGDFVQNTTYGNYWVTTSPIDLTLSQSVNYSNVPVNSKLTYEGFNSNLVYVILDSFVSAGTQRESNSSLYRRLLHTAGSKNMSSESGIKNLISEHFPNFPIIGIFGNTDEQVTRNKITVYSGDTSDQYRIMNFKGKTFANEAIPHKAYDHIMVTYAEGVDGKLVLGEVQTYMELEASTDDYRGLYDRMGNLTFTSGYNIILDSDSFVTDTNWTFSDEYYDYGRLFYDDEIRIDGNEYVLGSSVQSYDIHRFIIDLLNAELPLEEQTQATT